MITKRQDQIHKMWDHLNWLKSQKEKNLEGALRYDNIILYTFEYLQVYYT
jgi:hypothetical protein